MAAATPQERAAAAVPALRRGANNERWCCCQLAATAASRLRAPMFQALPAFHVQCSSLTPAGVVWSSLRRAAAGEGAEAHDLQSGEVSGACRSGRRRWGARSAVRRRGDVFLGACRRGRRRGGLQLYQLRAAWGATGQLSGIWLGLWVGASGGCRAKRLYLHNFSKNRRALSRLLAANMLFRRPRAALRRRPPCGRPAVVRRRPAAAVASADASAS